jgi:hypothetical protein
METEFAKTIRSRKKWQGKADITEVHRGRGNARRFISADSLTQGVTNTDRAQRILLLVQVPVLLQGIGEGDIPVRMAPMSKGIT